ncbi:hypothetical protein V6N11_053001 [Hibiscus sabdariffa]|uniref:RNase H type-1 domain-containing protein n=1 Tax=Hibiscus sabdariffa TaxID=183260 RepID=A0ABR2UBT2_9ROSI
MLVHSTSNPLASSLNPGRTQVGLLRLLTTGFNGHGDRSNSNALFSSSAIAYILNIKCLGPSDSDDQSNLKQLCMFCGITALLDHYGCKSFPRPSTGGLVGFGKAIGHSDSLQAELWALFEGMKLAWKFGFEKKTGMRDSEEIIVFKSAGSVDGLELEAQLVYEAYVKLV